MILYRSVGINATTAATEQNITIDLAAMALAGRDGFLRLAVMFLGVGVLTDTKLCLVSN
jgi:hypothetical protein